jgi:hypothetical protein
MRKAVGVLCAPPKAKQKQNLLLFEENNASEKEMQRREKANF